VRYCTAGRHACAGLRIRRSTASESSASPALNDGMSMKFLLRLLTATLLLSPIAALAGSVQVTVLSADGKPAAHTVVQVTPAALPANRPALPATTVISQQDIRFQPFVSVVPVGASVRFVNLDAFDHHVRSMPGGPLGSIAPAKQFDLRVGAAKGGKDQTTEVVLDQPGVIALGCHLHGSMRGHLLVSATPWAAVSDANGRVRLDGVPDGAAELRIWHPEQLVDQAPQALQVGADTQVQPKLNFSPRVRAAAARTAAPSTEYNPR
jgi:plastocyanin